MEESLYIQGRALLMDEDRARSAWRCGQLAGSGWEVVQAADAAEALTAACGEDVDLALLRVRADEAEALDLPRVLRLAAGMPHLPVIVMAPDPCEQARCEYLDSGADEIVAESVSAAELTARMRALMRVKVLHDELAESREALAASLKREQALLAQLRRDKAHLLTLCGTDALTHLQNVRHFDSFLENQFRIARRYGRPVSVLMFDLDHFKIVNDTHGHPSGDYVLKEFAVILKRSVRDSDFVARTGGEEFSIVLPDASRDQARSFAQRIRKTAAARKFIVFGQCIHVTCSIGLASYPADAQATEAHMLVYFADQALLRAKQNGRDRVFGFNQIEASVRRRLRQQYLAERPGCPDEPNPAQDTASGPASAARYP